MIGSLRRVGGLLAASLLAACASTPKIDADVALSAAALLEARLERTARLDQLAAAERYPELIELLLADASPADEDTDQVWMENRLASGAASVMLAYPYIRRLKALGQRDAMHLWFVYGAVAVLVDAARCADPSAALGPVAYWRAATKDISQSFERRTPEAQKALAADALKLEEATAEWRKPDRWMCSGGDEYWAAHAERHPAEADAARDRAARTGLRRDLDIPIYALDDEAWRRRRARIRAAFAAALIERAGDGEAL